MLITNIMNNTTTLTVISAILMAVTLVVGAGTLREEQHHQHLPLRKTMGMVMVTQRH